MSELHSAHAALPALYWAEVSVFRGRWIMSVIGPDQGMAAGPNLDLGPADEYTTARPDDPGRYLIAVTGRVPVLPRDQAERVLAQQRFGVEGAARDDDKTFHGWTQVATTVWTARCQRLVS
ncbi:hypothetical protein AB0J38_21890 [Streptomyces sp. NPDC050095]|uniref:hypothetical protein n=1 Tax=unclassified Streptomyces TaxID=2593676 RepID=UPI003417E27C